jgi:hypothetical protein
MKTLKTFCLVCLAVLTFSCNKDDDSSETTQKTTLELLTSGKWYFESKTPGTYTACEKKGYILFKTNGDLIINSFDDSSGTCESLGEVTATYTLTNDENINLVFGSETQSAKINSISESELKITNNDTGEVNVFDKTEG